MNESHQLMCLVCMYVRPRPGLDHDEDALGELSVLTVARGQMVCMRHVSCAQETVHATILAGVSQESRGTIENLSAYQTWRAAQDAE